MQKLTLRKPSLNKYVFNYETQKNNLKMHTLWSINSQGN